MSPATHTRDPQPIIALHGFTGSAESFSPVFRRLHERESPMASTAASPMESPTALTLPGHAPQHSVAPAGFVANVDIVAHQLANALANALPGNKQPGRCHLVGYSLGARVALGIAARHPHLITRLTLIGVHPGLASAAERANRVRADARLITLLRTDGIEAFVNRWQAHPIFATQARLPASVTDRQRRTRLAHAPHALADSLEHMGLGVMPDYRPAFEQLPASVPVTLVSGALDHKFTALARQLAASRPGTRVSIIDDAGHNPIIERPAAIAALLVT